VDEPVTEDELARARALVESAELGALARMEEVADRLSQFATYFDRPELINEQLSRYLAVDAAAIQAVARQVFRPDNIAIITYVPAVAADEEAA
jgi:predicted Zn-dependent peptidase